MASYSNLDILEEIRRQQYKNKKKPKILVELRRYFAPGPSICNATLNSAAKLADEFSISDLRQLDADYTPVDYVNYFCVQSQTLKPDGTISIHFDSYLSLTDAAECKKRLFEQYLDEKKLSVSGNDSSVSITDSGIISSCFLTDEYFYSQIQKFDVTLSDFNDLNLIAAFVMPGQNITEPLIRFDSRLFNSKQLQQELKTQSYNEMYASSGFYHADYQLLGTDQYPVLITCPYDPNGSIDLEHRSSHEYLDELYAQAHTKAIHEFKKILEPAKLLAEAESTRIWNAGRGLFILEQTDENGMLFFDYLSPNQARAIMIQNGMQTIQENLL
ncbi:MAG: hypothetical protein ACOYB8_08555 [Eubacteriaceae bacterium]|jgi:hypothetical protein